MACNLKNLQSSGKQRSHTVVKDVDTGTNFLGLDSSTALTSSAMFTWEDN